MVPPLSQLFLVWYHPSLNYLLSDNTPPSLQTRVSVSNIRPVLHCNTKKTPRVISVGEDSSVRLLSAATGQSVSTILPPPDISPLNKVIVYHVRMFGYYWGDFAPIWK